MGHVLPQKWNGKAYHCVLHVLSCSTRPVWVHVERHQARCGTDWQFSLGASDKVNLCEEIKDCVTICFWAVFAYSHNHWTSPTKWYYIDSIDWFVSYNKTPKQLCYYNVSTDWLVISIGKNNQLKAGQQRATKSFLQIQPMQRLSFVMFSSSQPSPLGLHAANNIVPVIDKGLLYSRDIFTNVNIYARIGVSSWKTRQWKKIK